MSDAKQGSQHISARCVNTSQGRIKLLITAKNVISAGRSNNIHENFFFVCLDIMLAVQKNEGYLLSESKVLQRNVSSMSA